jgi:hypothetical protein
MRQVKGWTLRLVAAALLLASATPALPSLEAAAPQSKAPVVAQDEPPTKCCFNNPRHSGTCVVEPGKDESCGSILAFLNNPMSQGKTYCGNTQVRGGWKSVSCRAGT